MLGKSISTFLILAILIGSLTNVYASQIDATIFPQTKQGFGELTAVQTLSIVYNGEKVKSLFSGVDKKIEFKVDSSNEDVKKLNDMINQNIKELKSAVTFDNINVRYVGTLRGDDSSAILDVKVIIDFELTNFIISGDAVTGIRSDLNWRGLKISEPVIINIADIGAIDINSIKGFLEKAYPDALTILSNENELITKPILDFTSIKELPLSNWHSSFDAGGAVAESEKYKITGDVPPVITILAKGEGSFREGIHRETEIDKELNIDGESVKLKMIIPASIASIRLSGYAVTEAKGDVEYVIVTNNPPAGKQVYSSQNLPITVVAVFAAMAAVITGIVIWKVNKK